MGEINVIQVSVGVIGGVLGTLFLFSFVALIRHQIAVKKQKMSDLTTKSIGLIMSETNGQFTSYRLGDLNFKQFESKVRELVGQLNEEVNENLAILDSSYVSILARYSEDKTESLLAIREAISMSSAQQPLEATPVEAPVFQDSFESASAVASAQPGIDASSVIQSDESVDEFTDFAQSIEATAAVSNGLFDTGDSTIAAEQPTQEQFQQAVPQQPLQQPEAPQQVASSQPVQPVQ